MLWVRLWQHLPHCMLNQEAGKRFPLLSTLLNTKPAQVTIRQ